MEKIVYSKIYQLGGAQEIFYYQKTNCENKSLEERIISMNNFVDNK